MLSGFSYRDLLDSLYDGVYLLDRNRVIRYWNKAAERISGFTAKEVIGRSCADDILMHINSDGCNLCEKGCPVTETLKNCKRHEDVVFLRHKSGHRIQVHIRCSPIYDDQNNVIGVVESFYEANKIRELEREIVSLKHDAFVDTLTGLYNRRHIIKQLEGSMDEFHRYDHTFGVVLIDVDHFKKINDTHGHAVGDQVLQMISNTLSHNTRASDVIGRWGGEEFIGICRNIRGIFHLHEIATRLKLLIAASTRMDQPFVHCTVSIGVSISVAGDSVQDILRRADELLYKAKNGGRNRVEIDELPDHTSHITNSPSRHAVQIPTLLADDEAGLRMPQSRRRQPHPAATISKGVHRTQDLGPSAMDRDLDGFKSSHTVRFAGAGAASIEMAGPKNGGGKTLK